MADSPLPDSLRVVVTGLGAITPIGNTVGDFWRGAVAGATGAANITRFDASDFPVRFAAEVKGFDPAALLDRKQANRLDRYAQFALVAADEAVRDAALAPERMSLDARTRAGVIVGSCIGGMETFQQQTIVWHEQGPSRISPFFVPMMLANMASGFVSMRYGFHGPNVAPNSACGTGNHAIALAADSIRLGDADVMLAGGSEAAICALGVGGFAAMKALSTRNDSPRTASRPFDAGRDGFVMGEGAGMLVLESLAHARARGARVLAEVAAVGTSADAYHMTAPHPEGLGARLAMERALTAARVSPSDVDTINMHGTSTPLGDAAESAAVRRVFGAHADRLTATSTKGQTGHLLGAAGAIEGVLCVLSIRHGIVPPTINHEIDDPRCDLNYAFNAPVTRPVRVAMSNAFGFGGHNTSAIFRALD